MTTSRTTKPAIPFRLPEPPEREPDEKMTNFDHLHRLGNAYHLALHFGKPETTLVRADRWIVAAPGTYRTLARYPDLLIAFGVNPAAYEANNGYIISEQGKPPDFVLEVASVSTGAIDVGAKRDDYAALGIPEYWRFDHTGEYHGARLAGDTLVNGRYEPLPIEELPDGSLQGYSRVLNLYLRWEQGQLGWYDPDAGRHIITLEDERASRIEAQARVRELEDEREARIEAEARVRELEEKLRQLRGET